MTDTDALPSLPDCVLDCIRAYGDAREDDDGTSAQRWDQLMHELRNWAAAPAIYAAPVAWIVRHRNDTPQTIPTVYMVESAARAHANEYMPGVARVVALVEIGKAPPAPIHQGDAP